MLLLLAACYRDTGRGMEDYMEIYGWTRGGFKQADIHLLRNNFSPVLEFLLHIVEFDCNIFSL